MSIPIADLVSSLEFNLLPCPFPNQRGVTHVQPSIVSNVKGKMRTVVPPIVSYTLDLSHPLVATTGAAAEKSLGAPLGIGQLKLKEPMRYYGSQKPTVRAWLVEVELWMRLMLYPLTEWVNIGNLV